MFTYRAKEKGFFQINSHKQSQNPRCWKGPLGFIKSNLMNLLKQVPYKRLHRKIFRSEWYSKFYFTESLLKAEHNFSGH